MILLVEDNPGDVRLIRDMLSKATGVSFALESTDRLATALKRLGEGGIDAVLLDLNLPDSLGLETFLRLHTQAPHVPIILLTGLEDEALGMRAVQEGAQDYLVKAQVDSDLLSRALRYAIERKRVEAELQARTRELRAKTERLEALVSLSRTASATLDPQGVLDFVVGATVRLLNVNLARLWLWNEAAHAFRLAASAGDPNLVDSLLGVELFSVALERWEIVTTHTPTDAHSEEQVGTSEKEIRTYAAVPLLMSERKVGMLVAARLAPEPFPGEELALLSSFAAQAAIAIENARLYEAQRLAALHLEATVEDRTRELQIANAQLQQAMRRAEEASRFKSEFLANMSHELRTPLNAVIGFSDLLINRISGELNEKQAKYANHILQAGRHLLALINDILDLSRVEAGKMELWPETFPLSEALEAVVTLVKPQAAKKRISLYSTINSDVTTITADPLRFKQVMFNLLGNAVKFTDEQGQIRVAARTLYGSELPVCEKPSSAGEPSTVTPEPQQEFVEISVQDTGIGISPEDQEKLFQEFSQVGGECARRQRGAGLGLALTKKLVELHGGRIRAESPGEGQGSTFTVTLPLKGPMALSGFEPSTSPAERLQNQPADPPTSGRGSTEGTASGES